MEKTLDLKMPGVMELGKKELKSVDGGVWWIVAIAAAKVITDIAFNPSDTKETFVNAAEAELAKINAEYN